MLLKELQRVKDMKGNWKVWFQKYKLLILRFSIPFLLLGVIGYHLLISPSIELSPVAESENSFEDAAMDDLKPTISSGKANQQTQRGNVMQPNAPFDEGGTDDPPLQKDVDKCDLFVGDWVPDPSGPTYTNESCSFIESHQNCMKNGRPDSGYLYWRWSPQNCKLPKFNAKKFLNLMRNKSWGLIGDSISRNHVQSLLCLLSQVEKATEIYHDEEYRSRTWLFPSYNFKVFAIWSPFLVHAVIHEDFNGVASSAVELHLDKLDKTWTDLYESFDYMVFSSGKWFIKASIYFENDTEVGCHYCPGRNLTEITSEFAYRNSLARVLNFIATSNHKGSIFLRTSTPDHFEYGGWDTGGVCNRTEPAKEGEIELKQFNTILNKVELEEFKNATAVASENGVNLRLINVATLSLLRPDGHPGPYRHFYPFAKDKNAKVQTDCLHWCLPGPIDSWNALLMQMVVNG